MTDGQQKSMRELSMSIYNINREMGEVKESVTAIKWVLGLVIMLNIAIISLLVI